MWESGGRKGKKSGKRADCARKKGPGALWEKRDPESLKQERIPQAKPVLQAVRMVLMEQKMWDSSEQCWQRTSFCNFR